MAHTRIRSMTRIALCTALLAVCAWLTFPTAIPFTLQSFAVALVFLLLGGRDGAVAVLLYLLLGCVGLPIFAGGQGGVRVLFGLTGGYLLGFLATAVPVCLFAKRRAWGVVLGLPLSYLIATAWITLLYADGRGLGWTLTVCVLPYILPDLLKLGAALLVARRLSRFV